MKKKTLTHSVPKGKNIKMGGKPVTDRLDKAIARLTHLEYLIAGIFKKNRVKAQFEDEFFWIANAKVAKKNSGDARRLQDLYLMHQLHTTRYNFYHDLIYGYVKK